MMEPNSGKSRSETMPTDDKSRLQGRRLLVVDDVLLNQTLAQAYLEREGAMVDVAADGAVAVAMVEQAGPGAYAAVLMDIEMPEMDGIEACRRIRALPGFSSLPVIGLTAHDEPAVIERMREAGMDGHLSKPIAYVALIEMLVQET